jgi:HD-GYP domain-containing protein (c-di-GMP phosphodiesterase class II)
MTAFAEITQGQLEALLRVSASLIGSLEMAEVLQTAIDGAVEALELETGAIYLLSGDTLFLGATTPELPHDFPDEYRRAPVADHPHIGRSLASGEIVGVPDMLEAELSPAERGVSDARGLRTVFFVPLIIDSEPVGVFTVGTVTGTRELTGAAMSVCRTIAHQAALAITNAHLYESIRAARHDLEHAYDATLKGWSAALEMRDADTCGHTIRTAAMTVDLAKALGVPEAQHPHTYRGALLHDIGKMTVPDAILNKPGPLDDDEWAVMREHPERAYRMLHDIEYLHPALDIPYCHHERWDGQGYPRGLEGEEIPFCARIFSVIDVYEALTSDRPYRAAWSDSRAREHIRASAGTQFDPQVVEAFLRLLAERDGV